MDNGTGEAIRDSVALTEREIAIIQGTLGSVREALLADHRSMSWRKLQDLCRAIDAASLTLAGARPDDLEPFFPSRPR